MKNLLLGSGTPHPLLKYNLKIKISTLFLAMVMFTMQASSYSQRTKITLDLKNVSIERFIDEIEYSTEFRFVYKTKDVDLGRAVTIKVKNERIEKILQRVFGNTRTAFAIADSDRLIHLKKRVIEESGQPTLDQGAVGEAVQNTVRGTVVDETGQPLPGASVLVKGTTNGTQTDFDGNFTIDVDSGSVLVFSYIGFESEEVAIGRSNTINVVLKVSAESLDEVVVTALGIKREKKALGYSVQEVSTDQLEVAQTASIGSKLSGKVAGLQVNTSARIGGSTRFVIRGESSLSTDGNEALIVVDGVPINGTSSVGGRVDYGGGVLDFNSDNVESVSVLKGPAAAALYGSRAGNGVILITTKSGEGGKPFSVQLKNSVTFESLLSYPDTYQYKYAPGRGITGTDLFVGRGEYNPQARYDTWGTGVYDPSQYIEWFYSPTSNGFRAGDVGIENKGVVTRYPFQSTGRNNFEEFFKTGQSLFNSIAVSTNSKNTSARFSYENVDQEGIQPNTDLKRNTISTNVTSRIGEKLKLNFVINYANVQSGNRPRSVWNSSDIMNAVFSLPPGTRIDQLRNYWQAGFEGERQFSYVPNGDPNPYFVSYERRNTQDRNRLFGNINLTYNFTDDLQLTLRHGDDYAFETRRGESAAGYVNRFDELYLEKLTTREANTDFLLGYTKDISDDFSLSLKVGGNFRNAKSTVTTSDGRLRFKGLFSAENYLVDHTAQIAPTNRERRLRRHVYSAYSFADLSFQDWAYLTLTARNDWASTLPKADNSFFYPSASLSIIASELFKLPRSFSFLKLRGAIAQVGKDASPQNLINTLDSGSNGFSVQNTLLNPTLVPEISTSWEVGLEARLFGGRIGLDATYYKSNTDNQIIDIGIPESSGFTSRLINAGEIENSGIELKLDAKIIDNEDFNWNTTLVYTANDNKLLRLDGNLTQRQLASFPNGYGAIISKVGLPVYGLFGYRQQTVDDPNSPFFGEKIHDANGAPLRRDDLEYIGNATPDFLLGITNEIRYKNVSLNFLVDVRQGGKLFSTNTDWLLGNGHNIQSQRWRDQGGVNGGGVIDQGDGTYRVNDVTVPALQLKQIYVNPYRNITEHHTYDASFVKLRELSLTYDLPNSLMDRLPMESMSFSLIGRDLFIWDDVPNQDPDILQNGIPGYSGIYGIVTTRSIGAAVNVSF